jgi:hypothetical protein
MKKFVYALVLVVSVGTMVADGDGKSCEIKDAKAKKVELTGTVVCSVTGEACEPVFKVANSTTQYKVCHGSKVDAKELTSTKFTYKVTGRITQCGDDGEVLVIEKASKI